MSVQSIHTNKHSLDKPINKGRRQKYNSPPKLYEQSASMFIHNNRYGFKVNISHPKIAPILVKYKKEHGLSIHHPMSDKDRLDFEHYVFRLVDKNET